MQYSGSPTATPHTRARIHACVCARARAKFTAPFPDRPLNFPRCQKLPDGEIWEHGKRREKLAAKKLVLHHLRNFALARMCANCVEEIRMATRARARASVESRDSRNKSRGDNPLESSMKRSRLGDENRKRFAIVEGFYGTPRIFCFCVDQRVRRVYNVISGRINPPNAVRKL